MSKAAEYRGIAAKLRREAERASIPQVRQDHLEAAEKWEAIAQELEASERSK